MLHNKVNLTLWLQIWSLKQNFHKLERSWSRSSVVYRSDCETMYWISILKWEHFGFMYVPIIGSLPRAFRNHVPIIGLRLRAFRKRIPTIGPLQGAMQKQSSTRSNAETCVIINPVEISFDIYRWYAVRVGHAYWARAPSYNIWW